MISSILSSSVSFSALFCKINNHCDVVKASHQFIQLFVGVCKLDTATKIMYNVRKNSTSGRLVLRGI